MPFVHANETIKYKFCERYEMKKASQNITN